MLIKYAKANIHHVSYATANLAGAATLKFLPGVNEIKDVEWEKVKGHPDVARMLEEGELVLLGGKKGAEFSEMDDKAALKLVKETLDFQVLLKWYKGTESESVKDAIEEQLKKLNVGLDGKPIVIDKKKEK